MNTQNDSSTPPNYKAWGVGFVILGLIGVILYLIFRDKEDCPKCPVNPSCPPCRRRTGNEPLGPLKSSQGTLITPTPTPQLQTSWLGLWRLKIGSEIVGLRFMNTSVVLIQLVTGNTPEAPTTYTYSRSDGLDSSSITLVISSTKDPKKYLTLIYNEVSKLMQVLIQKDGTTLMIGPFSKYNPPTPPTYVGPWQSTDMTLYITNATSAILKTSKGNINLNVQVSSAWVQGKVESNIVYLVGKTSSSTDVYRMSYNPIVDILEVWLKQEITTEPTQFIRIHK